MAKCLIEGCEREAGRGTRTLRGWCQGHYRMWQRYGGPLARPLREVNTGWCRVEGCDQPASGKRVNWCEKHYMRWHRNGHTSKRTMRKEKPSYRAAHWRVSHDRGKAREHDCADCGEQAGHWSFAWRDTPPERWLWENFNGIYLAYTGQPDDYEPRCHGCASHYDRDFAKEGWRQQQLAASAQLAQVGEGLA